MSIQIIRRKTVKLIIIFTSILIVSVILILLLMNGIIWFNNPSKKQFPVRGIDVSHYQGDIDWNVLSDQNVDFVFIKATEGSSHVDKRFAFNWDNANKTKLVVGAYHFFSFESSGKTQAENFIRTVPNISDTLPPVIDIEFYGSFAENPPELDKTRAEIDMFLSTLESHYGKKPILYVTHKTYNMYIKGYYKDNPIWIRNVYARPSLSDSRKWTFWQYSDHGRLEGYEGKEKFIDLNVFNGTMDEFLAFVRN